MVVLSVLEPSYREQHKYINNCFSYSLLIVYMVYYYFQSVKLLASASLLALEAANVLFCVPNFVCTLFLLKHRSPKGCSRALQQSLEGSAYSIHPERAVGHGPW